MGTTRRQDLERALTHLFASEHKHLEQTFVDDLPRKWERHGDLILFSASAFSRPCWKTIDQKILWKCVADALKVKRIAKQDVICADGIRSPTVQMLLGEETWVTHVDNKIKYSFDVAKCMFSSGNITEKIRMSSLNCLDETIVDMFAGIGYFTLPLLVHAKAKFVHACEWNPNAVTALRKNLVDNKVADRCQVYEGDNREVCPAGVAGRVILGLIPTAAGSFEAACRSLDQTLGGTLHIHCNVTSQMKNISTDDITKHNDAKSTSSKPNNKGIDYSNVTCNRRLKSEWLCWGIETAMEIQNILCSLDMKMQASVEGALHSCAWQVKILHIERVKSYAPHIDHLVLDLKCLPS